MGESDLSGGKRYTGKLLFRMGVVCLRTIMNNRWSKWLLAGLMPALLAACGINGSSGNGSEKANGDEGAKSDGPANLVFYSTAVWSQEAFNERFGDAIRKKFPNYTVQAIFNGKGTSFEDVMSSGVTIDIVWQDVNNTIPELLNYGLQYDMTELIKKYGVPVQNLEPTAINAIREMSDGKLYALPIVNNTAVLYYNKDLFDKFGVPYPTDGMTWDQAIDLAKRLYRSDGGVQYYGMRGGIQPHANLSPLSIPSIDPKTGKPTLLTDDRWKTLFSEVVEMKKTVENKALSFVKDPKVAMSLDLANIFINNDMSALNWDLVSYPAYKDKPGVGPQALPTLFGITSASKQKDEAMKVLSYLLSVEAQMSFSERAVIPILQNEQVKGAFGKNSPYKNKNLQSIVKTKFAPITSKSKFEGNIRTIYDKAIPDLVDGKVDLNTAFRSMDEQINKLIAEDKMKSK
ncbi:extracellular solute-binding protein [Paenibacillus hemerocallicola]|uniref:Extracellular solute-binding protein n=1 Tax=Paenibacillus hemerocallicola TaxID=1172614 RepID=A0A5C4TAB0_9BACL|nr:extracellular solute-binding protein [Paenibacillus hemerocallicola]